MSDFPMPFREIDGAPLSCQGKFAVGASRRPLVHVFMVQESMQLDCLKALVECLTKVVEDMHPDVKVVLLSYSSRLGVHRIGENQFRAPGSSAEVQYVQLAGDDGKGRPIHGNSSAMINNGGAVAAVCPVGVVADFLSTAKAVGDCTEDLQRALSDMCGSHSAYAANQNGAYSGTMPPDVSQWGSTGSAPQNMLCPILDEVCQWICEDTDTTQLAGSSSTMGTAGGLYAGDSDDEDFYGEEEEAEGLADHDGGVFGVLQDIGLGLIGATQQQQQQQAPPAKAAGNNGSGGGGEETAAMDRGGATGPVDRCSGVILHVFTSAPQDLPQGTHSSARSDSGGCSYFWSDDLASAVSSRGLSINLWGISSFESNSCDLACLGPLARRTGGSINRVVLGSYPGDEKARFGELLRRSLSSKQLATKGVLRIRASPCVNVLEESVSGHVQPDAKYAEVYHLAQCSSDSSVGCQIEYKNVDPSANLNPEDRGNKIAFQMAFCYDTLVEAPATTRLASGGDRSTGHAAGSVDPFLTAVAEMLEVDRSPSSPDKAGHTYAQEVDGALATLANNKREMLREIKRNQFTRNKPFYVAHAEDVLDGTSSEAPGLVAEGKDRDRATVGARHELNKVIKGSGSAYWGSTGMEHAEARPEACCYDRRRHLISVRKLRVFTVMVKCSNRPAKIVSSLRPSTLSLLIIRQAISDEIRFREALYSAELDGQPASSVSGGDTISPGMHFVDGWAASVVASCAAITSEGKDRTRTPSACEETLNVNFIVRSLQLLYGARKSFIDARSAARALVYQVSQQGASSRTLEQINDAVSRVVTDDFTAWAYQMCTSDARTTQKLLYPTFFALSPSEEPSSRGAGGEQVQWVVQKENPLPLKWESLYFKDSHAFVLDTGNTVILYKDSDPPPYSKPVAAAAAAPPPQLAPQAASAPPPSASPYKMPPPPPVTGAKEPPKSTGGFGFKALDVLGSIDRGVGHLLGDSRLDDSVVSEGEPVDTAATNESKDCEAFSLDGLADSLAKEYHWLPYEVFRNMTFSPLVPSIVVTEKGTNAIAPFSAALIEDTPDIQGDPYACESYGRFIAKAVKTAEEEVKDLIK